MMTAPAAVASLLIAAMPEGESPSTDYALSVNGRAVPAYACRVPAMPYNADGIVGQCKSVVTASDVPRPSMMPAMPPKRQRITASARNWRRMTFSLSPTAIRSPISRVRAANPPPASRTVAGRARASGSDTVGWAGSAGLRKTHPRRWPHRWDAVPSSLQPLSRRCGFFAGQSQSVT